MENCNGIVATSLAWGDWARELDILGEVERIENFSHFLADYPLPEVESGEFLSFSVAETFSLKSEDRFFVFENAWLPEPFFNGSIRICLNYP